MFADLDRQTIKKLVMMELQQKNKLKFFITPTKEGLTSGSLGAGLAGGALALAGNLITTTYIIDITFPASLSIEYDDNTLRPKSLVKGGEVVITFLEDEKGTVWRYLQTWRKTIAYVSPPKGGIVSGPTSVLFSSNVEYVFADNQEASERIGILILSTAKKTGYKFPRIMFYGLKFKGIEDITLGYTQSGNLTYSLKCSVREVAAPLV